MKRKYFFFDIDGTLTDPKTKQVVPSAAEALHQLIANGHFVAIATGRAHYKARSFTDSIGIFNVVCCGGGGIVLDGRLLENIPLDYPSAVSFLEHAEAEGRGWLLMLDDSDKCYMKDYRFLEQVGLRKEPTTYILDPDLDYHKLDRIMKVYIPITKEEGRDCSWLDLLGHLWLSEDYIVCQYDAKKDGILRMLELVSGAKEDVVVFGDDMNDLVMFDPEWTSIAMGNGKQMLKEKADYVTDASVDHGIWNACVEFGWIEGPKK